MSQTRVLTGITTSGTPHLGNYVGAIRPAVASSRRPEVEGFYFLADYHALIKVQDPARVQRSTLEIAATWMACGLEPDKVWFYRQSDVPETTELNWLLTCVAGKGVLNRAHAYKASVDKNREAGEDDDAGISAGLFMYPVLMAADILLFNAHKVPVGRDQIQHIEMARDFAQRFNHLYGDGAAGELLVLPEAVIEEQVSTLPGLDGRKMSKSYDNTIPLFCPRPQLKKLIYSIVTDSRAPGESKDADTSNVFQLYRAFADDAETAAMRQAFADGIAWGDAKAALFERIDAEIAPLRERYESLMARPAEIETILREGAARLRSQLAAPRLAVLRAAVGLRALSQISTGDAAGESDQASLPVFKQYREADGRFYFKLVDGERVLLQSGGFDSPREAGQHIGALRRDGFHPDDRTVTLGEEVLVADVAAALSALADDDARKADRKQASAG